jgi:hypothetical protein
MIRIGSYTPWGAAETVTPLGTEGAAFVSTPGHGGVYLPPALAKKMPASIVAASFLKSATWWEEDCDAAWPMVVLELGSEADQAAARSFLGCYKPELLAHLDGAYPTGLLSLERN